MGTLFTMYAFGIYYSLDQFGTKPQALAVKADIPACNDFIFEQVKFLKHSIF